jgi:heat-inducible transcriptional repressor
VVRLTDTDMLDSRSKLLLRALVERYIADGQPVGSRTLSKAAGLDLSPATIRNVMSDLEDLGLIASPHTSAGRIPTPKGYRLFVDTMLTVRRGSMVDADNFKGSVIAADQPQRVIANAAQLLSSLSQFVGVVMAPKRASVFKHIEFLSLSEHRVLVIIVAPDGDVQNRVVHLAKGPSQSQLVEAANYLNAHYSGQPLLAVRERLRLEVDDLRGEISDLMKLAVETGMQAMESQDEVVISGERNLLSVSDYSGNLGNLRKLFDLFEQKTQLMGLLEVSDVAEGVRIYIGGEGRLVPVQDMAIVSAPYEVDGTVVGTLGVIGPQRMPYDKMIQIVDITSKLVGNALSQAK